MDQFSGEQIRQLVALRLALESAMKSAKTAGAYQRGAATVALDSVVERVSALVLVSSGHKLNQNAKLDDYVAQLKNLLNEKWDPQALLFDVRQLRRARNAAQHEALEPDRESLPIWSRVTEQYASGLVKAAFGVDIRRVVLSDAITDERLRMSFAAAEGALEVGDIKRSVETAMGAYKLALTRWRSLTKRPERRWANRPHDEQSQRIRTLEAISEANSFAVDGGEADWFSRALTEGLSADMSQFFDRDDAERVLSFAFTWILGFERTSATWVPDRYLRAATVARNVRTGDARAGIDSFTLGDVGRSVAFVLSNVPPEAEYFEWASTLQSLLGTAAGQYQWKVRQDGTVHVLRMTVGADDLVNDARRLVKALAEAETTALAKSRAELERVVRTRARAKQLDDSLASFSFPTWVEQIRWDGLWAASTGGWVIHTIPDVEGLQLVGDKDVRASIASQPIVEMCSYRGTRQLAIAPLLEGTQLHDLLWEIDPLVQSALDRKKETDRAKRTDAAKLRQRIEEVTKVVPVAQVDFAT